ncbi:MAG: hypothetical protein HC769_19825 [Cyanobacteria bacterium CRU_2_1]|nr:hypothetical protein [Cyanobacteria bacterium CRU_2_1]
MTIAVWFYSGDRQAQKTDADRPPNPNYPPQNRNIRAKSSIDSPWNCNNQAQKGDRGVPEAANFASFCIYSHSHIG